MRIIYFGKPSGASERVLFKLERAGTEIERMPLGALDAIDALDGWATRDLCVLISHDGDARRSIGELRRRGIAAPALVLHDAPEGAISAGLLDAGADDVLGAAMDEVEISARIRAAARRASGQAENTVTLGDLAVPLDGGPVTVAGQAVKLSGREQDILRMIAVRYPRQISKATIYDALFALSGSAPHMKVIDSHIHNLRRKLAAADALGRDFIETAVGLGYRLGPRAS